MNIFLAAKGAALEATFKLVNQSKSVMSCNFRHSDILLSPKLLRVHSLLNSSVSVIFHL